jgi:class 3 adenylate cyclase/tetratricopeptide (TPR) repeat protein
VAVERLASLLPMDRRQAIAEGKELADRCDGSVLVADISGFTRLAERLTDLHGIRRGAEELTVRLNRTYDALIGEIQAYGGSVIGFSGDAITCWFDASGDNGTGPGGDGRERAARHAVAAAAGMRASLSAMDDDSALAVKVAIATGPARRFLVGDPSLHQLEVLAGATLGRVAACEKHAADGQVVVDQCTADLTRCDWRREQGRDGREIALLVRHQVKEPAAPCHPALTGRMTEELLGRWLLPGVNLAHGDFVTELRTTVPMFLGFEGIAYDDDPAAGEKLDAFVRWVQTVLKRYEASLLDITIDGKGSYLYVNFGAPVAHEDDVFRAATAARELCAPPPDVGFVRGIRIGLSRGTVHAGIVGSSTRRAYAALGDDVNLAARLMERARPGEVIVSERVRDKLGDAFDLTSLALAELKGKAVPVRVWRLGAPRREGRLLTRTSAPLAGRMGERAIIQRALERLLQGHSGVLVVEGEPGLGKSRLVEHAQGRAVQMGARYLVGLGDPVGQATLFHGWRPVFRSVYAPALAEAGADVVPGIEARTVELTENGGDAAFAPLLAPVLSVDLPETEDTSLLDGQVRADRTLGLMVDVLRGVASGTPLMLVLEDAHWLDTSSWALLKRVVHQVQPLLVVCVTRPPEAPPPEFSDLLAAPITTKIVLEPLGAEDMLTVVRQRLGVTTLPTEVGSLIEAKAEGNPFFGEELASSLRDRGVIEIRDGSCHLVATRSQLRSLDVPDSVEGVISGRIDRLTDSQRLAIKFASVIGRDFRLGTLREIHPFADYAARLESDLAVLADRDLMTVVSFEPEPTFAFNHAITLDVAYDMLLFRQRAGLHRAVATWFESRFGDNLAPHYATLAHHWRHALDGAGDDQQALQRALDYGGWAAEAALKNNAHVEATEELRKVIELLSTTDPGTNRDQREFRAQSLLGYSLMNQRGYGDPDVEAAYSRARALTVSSRAASEDGPPLYGLFSYYASRGDYAPAHQVARELLTLGEALDDPQVLLIAHNAATVVSVLRGDLKAGREHAEVSYRLADRHQDPEMVLSYGGDFRGYPRVWLSTAQCLLGEPELATRTMHDALDLTRGHPYTFAFMLTFGITPILRADLDQTLTYADQLTDVSRRYGFDLLVLVADIHRGWARALRGDHAGIELITQALPVIKAVKLDSFLPMYLGLLAEAQLTDDRAEDATASLDEAASYVAAAGGSFYGPELGRLRGRLHRLHGQMEAANSCFDQADALARRQGARWWELRLAEERRRPS